MIVSPYKAEHLSRVRLQGSQQYGLPFITPEHAAALEQTLSFSALDGDTVLCCFGAAEIWTGRALLWGFVGGDAGPHWLAIHRAVKTGIDLFPWRRLEMHVDCEFEAGHRWARMLGFTMECERMRRHRVDGGDSALYARVK